MKYLFTFLWFAVVVMTSCRDYTNVVKLPAPDKNFIGKWNRNNDIIISINSDSIIISNFRDKKKIYAIPSPSTKTITVIKNNDSEYKIMEEGSQFSIGHTIIYNKEDNTIKYGDKILLKDTINNISSDF